MAESFKENGKKDEMKDDDGSRDKLSSYQREKIDGLNHDEDQQELLSILVPQL